MCYLNHLTHDTLGSISASLNVIHNRVNYIIFVSMWRLVVIKRIQYGFSSQVFRFFDKQLFFVNDASELVSVIICDHGFVFHSSWLVEQVELSENLLQILVTTQDNQF